MIISCYYNTYLVNNKYRNEDDIIVEGEFPIFSNPGRPPDNSSKEQAHKHSRHIRLREDIEGAGPSGETTGGVCM